MTRSSRRWRRANDPDLSTVDLNDLLCGKTTCPAVIGGVLAYYDGSHMTATFARTLAPYLEPSLVAAVAQAGAQ